MFGVETILVLLRVTAFTSAACLIAAMVAEARGARPAAWLGALAVSHTLHLAFIVMRSVELGGSWMPAMAVAFNVIFGGAAYVLIYLLAWHGRMDSRLLSFGAYYVWAILFLGYAGKVTRTPWRGAVALALAAALVMRVAARRRQKALAAQSSG